MTAGPVSIFGLLTTMRIDLIASVLPLAVILASASDAQLCSVREYGWTNAVGGEGKDDPLRIVSDPSGRVYVTGAFLEKVDFRPDKKRDYHKNKGDYALFLSSYEYDGGYRWTVSLSNRGGYIHGLALALSPANHIVVGGRFRGKVDFRAGPGRDVMKAHSDGSDAFVALYDDDGTYGWARAFRGPGHASSRAVAVDGLGNILVAGDFSKWTDFDPGRRKDIQRTDGNGSVFVSKLSPQGSYVWSRSLPGDSTDFGEGIATGPDGEVVSVGMFSGETDFDPGEGRDLRRTAGETDVFAINLDTEGHREWVYTIGGIGYDFVRDVTIDHDGNIYIVGGFHFTVEFDPDGGGESREAESLDAYIVKLSPSGEVVWVRVLTGPGVEAAHGIALRPDGLLAISGTFTESADFDPSAGVDWRTSRGAYDAFVVFLTADGHYIGADTFGGTDRSGETARTITFDPDGSPIMAGTFDSSDCDFDPTSGVDLRVGTNDDSDIFTTKLYCGSCKYVERHTILLPEKRTLKGEVRALVPGGRVTVECTPTDPPGEPVETPVRIKDDNTGKYTLTKLDKGEYACAIIEVRDADGKVVCDQPAGRRRVSVK